MKYIKLFCVIISLLICCGCSKNAVNPSSDSQINNNDSSKDISAHLLYCSTDSINPFKCVTDTNHALSFLLYDPLIKLNQNFELEYYLAADIKTEGTVCTVTLNKVFFTDKSALSAQDIVFSANLAKSSQRYSQQLNNMASCIAVSNETVQFNLLSPDPHFINLLDFPIIKAGSDTLVNEDNISLAPIGCGRYVIDTETAVLTANDSYYKGGIKINKIKLMDAPDSESVTQRLRSGKISAYYSDLSDNTVPNMNGKIASVPLNNLVYIGCNMNSGIFKSVWARQAVCSAINRDAIVKFAYYDNAEAATGPFPTKWEAAAKKQNILTTSNINLAVENFDRLGYNKDEDGFYLTSNGKKLTVTLLVNNENIYKIGTAQMVAKQLGDMGIEVKINSLPYSSYIAALGSGQFDLYIAEVNILNNMDISPLVTFGSSCSYGIAKPKTEQPKNPNSELSDTQEQENEQEQTENKINLTTAEAAKGYKNKSLSLQDLITVFNTEMPIIPICYRNGILLYNDDYTTAPTPSVSDAYYNFEKFTTK